jgi:hypothetical protein
LDTPTQVRRAVHLLWISLTISIVDAVFTFEPLSGEDTSFQVAMALIFVVTFAAWALVIHFVSRGRNWARIVLLLLTTAGLLIYAISPGDFGAEPWWSWLAAGVSATLDIVALVMLFSGSGAKWYSSRVVA